MDRGEENLPVLRHLLFLVIITEKISVLRSWKSTACSESHAFKFISRSAALHAVFVRYLNSYAVTVTKIIIFLLF